MPGHLPGAKEARHGYARLARREPLRFNPVAKSIDGLRLGRG